MAESIPTPVNGKKLILSMAIGGDLIVRLRLAAGKAGQVGWVAETVSPFGVVASVAKLFDLSEEVIANAMGAAYAFCSGNNAFYSGWSLGCLVACWNRVPEVE